MVCRFWRHEQYNLHEHELYHFDWNGIFFPFEFGNMFVFFYFQMCTICASIFIWGDWISLTTLQTYRNWHTKSKLSCLFQQFSCIWNIEIWFIILCKHFPSSCSATKDHQNKNKTIIIFIYVTVILFRVICD